MLAFLSPDWLAALHDAARADQGLAEATATIDLVVEQRVAADPDGPPTSADAVYHVVLDHGRASVAAGPAPAPTIRFSQDLGTARAIAMGTESAQRAFMTGRVRVGGDLRVLLDHQEVLAALGDAFAAVRARTDFGDDGA